LGLGDADEPGTLPAAHTDMILSAVGEELGFGGVLAVFVLFGVLVYRGFQIALRAPGHYTFFLALGLTVNAALQFLLITGGATGVVPLSGVVLPFLSSGRTALLANFAAFGVLLAISARAQESADRGQSFRVPVRALGAVLGVLGFVVLAKVAYVQVVRADELLVRKANVVVARRGGQPIRGDLLNPRLEAVARTIERGSIYDRTGLPLVTSKREELLASPARDRYREMGIDVEHLQPGRDGRYRPFGGITFHLLGSLSREDARMLRGYTDERELLPLLRYRYAKEQPEYKEFVERDRNMKLTIDAGLQVAVARILEARLGGQRKSGAAVVVEPRTGELLASVSYPWPTDEKAGEDDPTRATPVGDDTEEDPRFDKARLGRFPPGSTFKIVTAIAALRKDPALETQTYECKDLGDGPYPGARFNGFTVHDSHRFADGETKMDWAIRVSCNAYFAQLGFHGVGAQALFETAKLLRVERLATPDTPASLRELLGHAAYGQGEVEVSPLTIARVAATVAAGGVVPPDVFVMGGPARGASAEPRPILARELAEHLATYMHNVVLAGTAVLLKDKTIAGKTGTAEVEVRGKEVTPHAWFMGFAPFDPPDPERRRIAFSVLVVRGGRGAEAAAPIGQDIVAAARARKLIK
jgi:cell division protein FtsI/penicillin-binding protein 2